jgi:hypothetical protein
MPIPSAQEEYRSSWAGRVLLRCRHLGKLCYLKAEVTSKRSHVVPGQADFAGGGTQPVSRGAAAGRAHAVTPTRLVSL